MSPANPLLPVAKALCLLLALVVFGFLVWKRNLNADFGKIYKSVEIWVIGIFVFIVLFVTLYYS